MLYIDKNDPGRRNAGLAECRRIINSCWYRGKYVNLTFDNVCKDNLAQILADEQDRLCCYCMRRLHTKTENGSGNVTLEHIIPHSISQEQWERERRRYRQYPTLSAKRVTVIENGKYKHVNKRLSKMPPMPHFLAYDNLVASCDGNMCDSNGNSISHHCCNNYRGSRYVEPLFYNKDISKLITYSRHGCILYDNTEWEEQFGDNGLNITDLILVRIRRFWAKVASSRYTDKDIQRGITDHNLRADVIDDLGGVDREGQWTFLYGDHSWRTLCEYDWFYHYYTAK